MEHWKREVLSIDSEISLLSLRYNELEARLNFARRRHRQLVRDREAKKIEKFDADIRSELLAPSSADVWDEDGGDVDHEVARLQVRHRQPRGSRSSPCPLRMFSSCHFNTRVISTHVSKAIHCQGLPLQKVNVWLASGSACANQANALALATSTASHVRKSSRSRPATTHAPGPCVGVGDDDVERVSAASAAEALAESVTHSMCFVSVVKRVGLIVVVESDCLGDPHQRK